MTGKGSKKSDPKAEEDETKRKFREALAAKQGRRTGEAHLDGGKDSSQPHGPVESKRVFRRKTG
ncbi:MAG TPA: DUF5302 domain-containing protein [Microlunatus sp.]